jgi:hypothetical protein
MGKDHPQGTATLARLFAAQGHWEKSAAIYRDLLQQNPERQDLARALSEAEAALRAAGPKSVRALVPVLQEWIDLLLKHDRLRKLRRFQSRISNSAQKTGAS